MRQQNQRAGATEQPYPHRLSFDSKPLPDPQDGYGGVTEVWSFAFRAWGDIEPLGGREFPVTARQAAEATARFRVRFRRPLMDDDTTVKYRIQYLGKVWDVHAVYQRDGLNHEIYLEASEVD